MRKWIIPLAYPIIYIVAFLLIGAVGVLGNGDGTGYGGVVIVLCGIIFYCLIIVPAISLIYSKLCLSGERFRVLFTLYQSLLISLTYLILFFKDNETFLYSVILFVWCELWSLLGLIKFKHKSQTQDQY